MADVTTRLFLRHLRGDADQLGPAPRRRARSAARASASPSGTGRCTAVLSEVPVDDRELPLLFHARTADFADVTVQATVTYRVADPALAAGRLDFSVDPRTGTLARPAPRPGRPRCSPSWPSSRPWTCSPGCPWRRR